VATASAKTRMYQYLGFDSTTLATLYLSIRPLLLCQFISFSFESTWLFRLNLVMIVDIMLYTVTDYTITPKHLLASPRVICPYVRIGEDRNRFALRMEFEGLTKICRHVPILIQFGKIINLMCSYICFTLRLCSITVYIFIVAENDVPILCPI
jgi:hypothetical protein